MYRPVRRLEVGAPFILLGLWLLISGVITGAWPDWHAFLRAPEFPSLGLWYSAWHWPLFFYATSGLYHMNPFMIVGWLVFIILGAQLLTWVYKNSGQSVFIVGLFHGTLDIVLLTGQSTPLVVGAINAVLIFAGLGVARLYGPTLLIRAREPVGSGNSSGLS